MEGLSFAITGDNANLMNALTQVKEGVKTATNEIEKGGEAVDDFFNKVKNIGSLSIAGIGISEMIKKIANTRAYFQDIESSMKVFLGSAEKGAEFTEKLQDYAYYNMFEFADLADASKQLIAYGNDVDDVIPVIDKLSNVATATSVPLAEMVNLYNRAKSTGVVGSQDMASWASKGLILKDVMKEMGTYVEGQTMSFKQLNEVLEHVTEEGGMFHGIMDAQMNNISANIGQLEDNLSLMFNEMGEYLQEPIFKALQFAGDLVDKWKDIGYAMVSVMAAVGTQKGVDLIASSYDRMLREQSYDAEIAKLKELLGHEEAEAKATGDQSISTQKLTGEKGKQIMALRAELQARNQSLIGQEANIIKEREEALQLKALYEADLKSAEAKVLACQQRVMAVNLSSDASLKEAAAIELARAEKERDTIANTVNAASEQADAAAKKLTTLESQKQALALNVETTATVKQNIASKALALTTNSLKKAWASLLNLFKSNPYGMAIAGVAALGYGIYKLATYESDEAKARREANEEREKSEIEIEKEKTKLDELQKKLDSTTKGSAEWKAAKDAIVKQYGQYLPNLDAEIEKTGSLKSSYDALTEAIKKNMQAKSLSNYLEKTDNSDDITEVYREALDKFQKKSKLRDSSKEILTPLLREYSLSYKGDATIYTFIKDQLKEQYGNAKGENFYNAIITTLKSSPLAGFNKAHAMTRERELEISGFIKDMGIDDETVNEVRWGIEKEVEEEIKDNKKYLEEQKKALEKELADLTEEEAKGDAGAKLKKEIQDLAKRIEDAYGTKSKNEKKSAQKATKTLKENNKYLELFKKQEEERLQLIEKFNYEQWQNRINLMDDGEAKVLAQMKLNHHKELYELNRQKKEDIKAEIERQKSLFDVEEEIKASKNSNYQKRIFNAGEDNIEETLSSLFDVERKLEEIKEKLSDTEIWNSSDSTLLDSLLEQEENLGKEWDSLHSRLGDVNQSFFAKILEQYDDLNEQLLDKQQKADEDRLFEAKEAINQYLQEFGSYKQKHLAIIEEYDQKISEAQNSGERMSLMSQKEQALADLDFSEWQENGGLALAFNDVTKLSKETISKLILDMEKYRSKMIATFDPEKIKEYEEALANLKFAQANSDIIFGENEIIDALHERLSLQKQLNDEEATQNSLIERRKQLELELSFMAIKGITPDMNPIGVDDEDNPIYEGGITQEMVERAQQFQVELDRINRTFKISYTRSQELSSQLEEMGKVKFADIQKFSQKLLKAGKNTSELASIFDEDLADAISTGTELLEGMFDAFTELSSNIEALSKTAKDVVEDTADAAEGIVDAASEGMKTSAASTSASLSTLEKASAILAIIGAAIQLATLMASLFNSDKQHEKNIERIQKQIDSLQSSYDKLSRSIEKAYSSDASKLIEQQNTLLKQQQTLIRQQMREEMMKKNSDDDKIKEYRDALSEIEEQIEDNKDKAKEAIIGEDIKSAISDFASAYSEAWEEGTEAAETSMKVVQSLITSSMQELIKKKIQPMTESFYNYLAKAMEKGFLNNSDLSHLDYLNEQIISAASELQEQYQEILERYADPEEIRERLTDISFDSLSSNFKGMLTDMENSAQDFSDNFEEMLRNALIQGLMEDKYDIMLREWYDEFAEAMRDHTLSDEERNALKQKYDDIIQQGLADRNFINEIVGGNSFSQQASTGNAWNMSQETGEELNGRFTAMVELEAINNSLVDMGNSYLLDILRNIQALSGLSMIPSKEGGDNTILAIKDMLFLSTGFLEDIAKYSKYLIRINQEIADMNSNIKKI